MTQTKEEAEENFRLLMRRPADYNRLSSEEQWAVDRKYGTLDAWVDPRWVTDAIRRQWRDHFGTNI